MKLNEGLQELDLQDLVLPLLSIDEFESKIDEEAIVIGFFVQDVEPAKDLERFIQKSAVNLLDTEVSTAPDEDGYFMLFVELTREPVSITRVLDILESLVGLTGLPANSWKFKAYNHDGVFPVDEEQLRVLVNFGSPDDVEVKDDEAEEDLDLNEFFRPSLLDNFTLVENRLILERLGRRIELELVDFGTNALLEKYDLTGQPLLMDRESRMSELNVETMLGENWSVNTVNGVMLLSNPSSTKMLLARAA